MDIKSLVDSAKNSNVFIFISVGLLLLSSIASLLANSATLKSFYISTWGNKSKLLNEIGTLSAGTSVVYFEEILGSPVFVNDFKANKEYIFINKYFYTQAVTDLNGKVLAYSITTRNKDFNPKITLGPWTADGRIINIELGKTKFSEIDNLKFSEPENVRSIVGAHNYFYTEEYYFGNPGNYQTYFFSLNQSGYAINTPPIMDHNTRLSISDPEIKEFRETNVINTYTVTAPMISIKELGITDFMDLMLGPDYNQVRVLNEKT